MKTRLLLAASLLLTTPLVWAQRDYQPIEQRLSAEQLQQVGLSAQQLQLLNRMLSEAQAAAPAPEEAPEAVQLMHIGLEEGPVHSKVQGAVDGWEPGTLFVLENGQQWKVLKGQMRLRQTLQSPEIEVVPGIAGRWFLQVDEDLPKARVYRVR
jgi:hypothetical protein